MGWSNGGGGGEGLQKQPERNVMNIMVMAKWRIFQYTYTYACIYVHACMIMCTRFSLQSAHFHGIHGVVKYLTTRRQTVESKK